MVRWVPAVVLQVTLTLTPALTLTLTLTITLTPTLTPTLNGNQVLVDGSFQALVKTRSDPFEDWFTWKDEGKDWRRPRGGAGSGSGSGSVGVSGHKRRVRSADDDAAASGLARRPTGHGQLPGEEPIASGGGGDPCGARGLHAAGGHGLHGLSVSYNGFSRHRAVSAACEPPACIGCGNLCAYPATTCPQPVPMSMSMCTLGERGGGRGRGAGVGTGSRVGDRLRRRRPRGAPLRSLPRLPRPVCHRAVHASLLPGVRGEVDPHRPTQLPRVQAGRQDAPLLPA